MNSTAYQPRATTEKTAVIRNQLKGSFGNDIWDLTDHFFETYGGGSSWTSPQKKMHFVLLPTNIRHEFQFFFATQLVNENISLKTAVVYSSSFVHLSKFLQKYYQKITSLVDIPYNHGLMKYKTFLTNQGIRITNKSGYNSNPITFFNSIINYLYQFYDTRDEMEKDIWDVRTLREVHNKWNQISHFF